MRYFLDETHCSFPDVKSFIRDAEVSGKAIFITRGIIVSLYDKYIKSLKIKDIKPIIYNRERFFIIRKKDIILVSDRYLCSTCGMGRGDSIDTFIQKMIELKLAGYNIQIIDFDDAFISKDRAEIISANFTYFKKYKIYFEK